MTCTREMPPWKADLIATSTEDAVIWDPQWYTSTGVAAIDFTADVRNVTTPGSSAISLKPALQLAAVRTDRPGAGGAITAGNAITAVSLTHYEETLSAATQFFFRRGWVYKLTAGSLARAETVLYTSFRSCGTVFPAREVVFQPTNDTAAVSYFPITGPFAAIGVDIAKLAVVIMDNANDKMEWRLAGRAFNDSMARGAWVDLQGGWNATTAGDPTPTNTGEVSLSGLTLTGNHWMELALAIRKSGISEPNSRAIFHVIPAIKYT